jgi:hypothetical protein
MAAKLTRLTHKIALQPHLMAESCTICSFRSRWPVWKLLDTPFYVSDQYELIENLIENISISISTFFILIIKLWAICSSSPLGPNMEPLCVINKPNRTRIWGWPVPHWIYGSILISSPVNALNFITTPITHCLLKSHLHNINWYSWLPYSAYTKLVAPAIQYFPLCCCVCAFLCFYKSSELSRFGWTGKFLIQLPPKHNKQILLLHSEDFSQKHVEILGVHTLIPFKKLLDVLFPSVPIHLL